MTNDLHLEAVRSIIINKSNKQEEQSYYIDLMQIKESQGANEIVNSSDPFKAYCNHIKELEVEYKWQDEPIYLWDIDKSVEANEKLVSCGFDDDEVDKYIIGYKKTSDRLIEVLNEQIKTALENGYRLNWTVW